MRLTLQQVGTFSYKHICQGRKSVGRVWQHAETKRWHGLVNLSKGRVEADGATESEAFANVCAKAFGFETPEALAANNSRVRATNRARKAEAREIANGLMAGGDAMFNALDRLLKK